MKIGIITIHNSPNYGASLQSFALWKYLSNQGYKCEIIDLYRSDFYGFIESKKYKQYYKKQRKLKDIIKLALEKILHRKLSKQYYSRSMQIKFEDFNNQIKMSAPYRCVDELYKNPPIYDIYITGSDQVWNPTQPYCVEPYFLTFVPQGCKRISYASSIGITDIPDDLKSEYKKWLSSYDAISVRENQAKKLLESFTDLHIDLTPDPTVILDADYWKSLATKPQISEPYILLFTLYHSLELKNFVSKIEKESNCKVLLLSQHYPKDIYKSFIHITDAGPKDFLGYIANAEMIFTDSFHCTIFSIILGAKNFYSYIHSSNKRGSRITYLLQTFKLDDHLLNTEKNISYKDLCSRKINYDEITKILEKEKYKGRDFLSKHLK